MSDDDAYPPGLYAEFGAAVIQFGVVFGVGLVVFWGQAHWIAVAVLTVVSLLTEFGVSRVWRVRSRSYVVMSLVLLAIALFGLAAVLLTNAAIFRLDLVPLVGWIAIVTVFRLVMLNIT